MVLGLLVTKEVVEPRVESLRLTYSEREGAKMCYFFLLRTGGFWETNEKRATQFAIHGVCHTSWGMAKGLHRLLDLVHCVW